MIKEQLAETIQTALINAKSSGELPLEMIPDIALEMPKNRAFGDWATNVALELARPLKMSPRDVAAKIVSLLPIGDDSLIVSANIAGPGFINLTLHPAWLGDILRRVQSEGDAYGCSQMDAPLKIIVEFVSTNPNGPITVAGGRNAAIGDVLSTLLTMIGHAVTREYYINDPPQSTQMNNFGLSVFHRYRQLLGHPEGALEDGETDDPIENAPEWLYLGEYVTDVARSILEAYGDTYEYSDRHDPQTVRTFRDLSEGGMIAQHSEDMEAFGVHFDEWFAESTLHADGRVQTVIDALIEGGHTYEKDGALWLKTLDLGDERDNVLVRSNGAPTYLTGDIAYHKDKLDRGFDLAINVWGADHAGAVARLKVALGMLGYDPNRLDILLYQLVRIVKNGELVKAAKRKGNFLELKVDLIDEIGKDASRFFFLMRSPNTDLDIDLDLAKKTEKENPVYYVQYAHARIVQTIEKAREEKGVTVPAEADLSLLTQDAEVDLIKKLSDYPDEIIMAADDQAPQRIVQYVRDLSSLFHGFYDAGNRNPSLRVVCEDVPTMEARLVLVDSTRYVLKNALTLLGLSAPERM